MTEPTQATTPVNKQAPWPLIIIIVAVFFAIVIWQVMKAPHEQTSPIVALPSPTPEVAATIDVVIVEEEITEIIIPEVELVEEPIVAEPILPRLNESDPWVEEKLLEVTWRKELLKLVINQDMIRRFVVFVDNFSQGDIVYAHSPLISPVAGFDAVESGLDDKQQTLWQWDDNSEKRFSLYVDLLRSFDRDTLVNWYFESKPLIDEAYQELGYDHDFTETLLDSFSKILDMETPKTPITLVRPSVMFKYQNSDLEALDDADKLLLRLGRDNLLVIKSVVLEMNEKLQQSQAN